jgi:fructose-1,6-bisphosphatase/inositol monophosphatase family enzyme
VEGVTDSDFLPAGGSDRRQETIKPKANSFAKLAAQDGEMVHAIRITGATTVTLVQVAAGQLDVYWYGSSYTEWHLLNRLGAHNLMPIGMLALTPGTWP